MHTDLSPHLHTDECNEIVRILRQCRIDHSLTKFLGKCNPDYNKMVDCLKQERLSRRKRNYELSQERKDKINKIYQDKAKINVENNA